mmetsp:Transcript_25677/g.24538  ORF Transcript_25677/g.24538 Transcript_25677/m.24538 type:complete len:188 (+) Transcript_25677:322-885(+)
MDSPIMRGILQSACLAAESVNHNVRILLDDDGFHQDGRKRSRPRQIARPNYSNSTWGKMLTDEADQLRISGSTASNLFRRRFRIPFMLFEMLMEDVYIWQKDVAAHDITGRHGIPLELKVLGVLRILGRASCFDGIKELTFISETTMHFFFIRLRLGFALKYILKWFVSQRQSQKWRRLWVHICFLF